MRGYLFTDNERRRLRRWLETWGEDTTTRSIFVNIRRNLNRITDDVGLLTDVAKMLRAQGRIIQPSDLRDFYQIIDQDLMGLVLD